MFFHVRLYDYPVSRRTAELRASHREYLAGLQAHLIARGATTSDDGAAIRGSIFFVEFPDRAAVERFVVEEPNYKAGVYMSYEITRWNNPLARKAGEYTGLEGEGRWYIRGYAKPGIEARRRELFESHAAYLHARDADIVVRGGATTDDGQWMGSAMVLRLPDRKAADDFAAGEPYCRNGLFERVVVERCGLAGPGHR